MAAGYDVVAAEDGFRALSQLRKKLPDVVLSDLDMPGMSGFELLSVMRRRFPQISTVAMSGAYVGDELPFGGRLFRQRRSIQESVKDHSTAASYCSSSKQ